jgi:uncharacterized protein YijF (DUF1287 family)
VPEATAGPQGGCADRSFATLARPTAMRLSLTRRAALLLALTLVSSLSRADTPPALVTRVIARARQEVARGVVYDSSYVRLAYPGGDVDPSRGVCTDVVIRALRVAGIDLQTRVHEDALARPRAYARYVTHADANIDHRRVGPLTVWLDAHARPLPLAPGAFAAGDLVVWSLRDNGTPEHIGLVSDRVGPRGLPLVVHNIGPAPSEDDSLDAWRILGHWRVVP